MAEEKEEEVAKQKEEVEESVTWMMGWLMKGCRWGMSLQ